MLPLALTLLELKREEERDIWMLGDDVMGLLNLDDGLPDASEDVALRLDLLTLVRLGVRDEVNLHNGDHVALGPELVAKVRDEEEGNGEVAADEVGSVPVTLEEDGPGVEERDDAGEDERVPTDEGLEPATVAELLAVEALLLGSLVEAEVRRGDTGPRDETDLRGHVRKVVEDLGRRSGTSRGESEETKGESNGNAEVRSAVAVGALEDLGSATVERESPQGTGAEVHVGGTGGEGGGEDTGVDDVGKAADADTGEGEHEGRRGGGTGLDLETGVGRGHDEGEDEDGDTEEEDDTNPHTADSLGHRALGVLRLTGRQTNVLNTDHAEGGAGEGGPVTEEAAEGTGDAEVLLEGAIDSGPELEADHLMLGVTARGNDDRGDDKADDKQNLDARLLVSVFQIALMLSHPATAHLPLYHSIGGTLPLHSSTCLPSLSCAFGGNRKHLQTRTQTLRKP